jgi:hypothetical protein
LWGRDQFFLNHLEKKIISFSSSSHFIQALGTLFSSSVGALVVADGRKLFHSFNVEKSGPSDRNRCGQVDSSLARRAK